MELLPVELKAADLADTFIFNSVRDSFGFVYGFQHIGFMGSDVSLRNTPGRQ